MNGARHLSIWIITLVISSGLLLASCASDQTQTNPDARAGVPIDFNDEGDIRISDPGVTPADLYDTNPDDYEPDDTRADAKPLQIDSPPQNHTIHADDDEDWYQISSSDKAYLIIGATGPIKIEDDGASDERYPPGSRAMLMQTIWYVLPGDRYVRISNLSDSPIVYRLSAVSKLPLIDRGIETAHDAAFEYIYAVAEGDRKTLFKTTRKRITKDQATSLRKKLFGQAEPIDIDIHRGVSDGSWESEYDLVQKMLLGSLENQQFYAFIVTCEKKDGFYLVASARRHRMTLSKKEKARLTQEEMVDDQECMRCHGGPETGTCTRKEPLDIGTIW